MRPAPAGRAHGVLRNSPAAILQRSSLCQQRTLVSILKTDIRPGPQLPRLARGSRRCSHPVRKPGRDAKDMLNAHQPILGLMCKRAGYRRTQPNARSDPRKVFRHQSAVLL